MTMQAGPVWLRIAVLAIFLPATVDSLDQAVRRDLHRRHDPHLQPAMQLVSDLARPEILLTALLAIALLDPLAGPATARVAVTSLVATGLVVEGVKFAVDRPRPYGKLRGWSSSFPSGHASGAFALAAVLARRWKRFAIGFWLLAAAVAFSRLYLDRHYLSDVVVAAVIGIVCASLVSRWRFASSWGLPRAKGEMRPP